MKAIMIVYNQALTEKIDLILDTLKIRGFTKWENVMGRGNEKGEPRMGSHTWPEMNSSTLVIIDDEKVNILLDATKKLDAINDEVGVRAFVWNIETMI